MSVLQHTSAVVYLIRLTDLWFEFLFENIYFLCFLLGNYPASGV